MTSTHLLRLPRSSTVGIWCMRLFIDSIKRLFRLGLGPNQLIYLTQFPRRNFFGIIILQLTATIRWIKEWNRRKKSFKDLIPVKISFIFHETTEHNRKKLFQRKTPSQLDSHEEMKTKSLFSVCWKQRIRSSGGLGKGDVSKQGRINREMPWFSII